ncbi:MAG: ArsR/SmtB family transcription factor [Anaerolineales bacterium]
MKTRIQPSPTSNEVDQFHADICSALADPRRLSIIYTLADGPQNVTSLSQTLQISQPATSRHLKVLRDRGLVTATREGSTMRYELADERLIEALDLLRAILRDRIAYRASFFESS